MKNLYLIGGTMGVGKTAVCNNLNNMLNNSVFLDGDWCWNANPFIVTDETKKIVEENIYYMLNNFIKCSAYENVVFCWVMHSQDIIDGILSNLNTNNCNVKAISLLCDKEELVSRLKGDIKKGVRTADVIDRSLERNTHYKDLNTVKIDTTHKSAEDVAKEIINKI